MAFVPVFVFATDFDGNPQSGAKLNLYQAGTTTPQAGYRDATGGTAHTNPVVCSAGGTEVVWLDDSLTYKLVLTNSAESTTFFTEDNISPSDFPGLVIWPAGQGDQTLLTTSSPVFAGMTLTGDFTGVDGEFTGTLTTVDINASGDLTVGGNIIPSGTVDGVDIAALKTDVDAFPDGLQSLSSAEVTQLLNINSTTISTTQWSYLGELNQALKVTDDVQFNTVAVSGNITTGGTVDGVDIASMRSDVDALQTEIALFDDELQSLTAAEVQQLQNIGIATISTAQWGYLGAFDQALATTDDVDFATINGAEIDITGAALGQALGFVTSTTKLEPYTAAGMGDLLKAANETITGTYTFSTAPDFDAAPTYDAGIVADARTNLGVYSTTQTDALIASVPNRVATLAAMTAIGVAALSAGYTLQIEEAERGGTFVLTDASYSDDGGVLFAPDTPVSNLHWRRVYDGPVHTKWFGLTLDGATDNTDDIQAIVTKYHDHLIFDDGDYYFEAASILANTPKGIDIPDNSRLEWSANAWFYHEASTDTNQLLGAQAGSNITLINPQINGQNATTNLLGFGSADNLLIKGGTLKNVKKSRQMALPDADPVVASGLGGGHGITMQGFSRNCRVVGVHFDTCAIALDGAPKNEGDSELGNVNRSYAGVISACTFHNCDQIFTSAGNVEANGSGEFIYDENETADEYKLSSWLLSACSFHNCGKSDGNVNIEFTRRNSTSSTEYPFACPARSGTSYNPATAGFNWEITDQSTSALALTGGRTAWTDGTSYDATDVVVMNDDGKFGALITGMNAGGIVIDGLSGYNDESYNGGTNIGAIVWGTFASCKFRNINVNVNTDYMVRFGGTPATVYNTIRHYQVSKFVDFEITNHGNTVYAYRIDNPIGVTNEYKLEGMRLKLAFRETGHTSLTHANNDAAFATNNKADESFVEIINLETQETLQGRIDILGNGSYELSSHADGIRTIQSNALQIVNHSADAMLRLTRTGTNTADIEIYALADRLQIDGGGLSVETLGVGTTPPTTKAMQVSYDSGHTAIPHEVFKFARAGGNFRGVAFGYLGDGSQDTVGYMAANNNESLVIGHGNNVNTGGTIFLTGSADVGIGTSSPNEKLDVRGAITWEPGTSVTPTRNGEVTVEFTNSTTLTFKGRAGGTVRTATLTLA